ncbi:MAG: deoxyguanosinetriphosphate triphosphohydrolase [Coriobacteriia bacterium]|nr:deoxyguanosinetriphosphate triphosphohydrolase [Coriobacteriia bacterium]
MQPLLPVNKSGVSIATPIKRIDLERRERAELSPFAAFSDATRGRETSRPLDEYRTEFQRDRERLLHCKSFRRLSHKTQVFLAPEGDHYRTRMTHTLEVAQIARSIARTLALNEDLTEAIALGHDLGHTPFGHTGEAAIDEALKELSQAAHTQAEGTPRSFNHARQSLRVVEDLEYEGAGLNLCWETRDGILGHSGQHMPATLEGQIVRTADRIAYINHDIDDALRAGVLQPGDVPQQYCEVLGHTAPQRITTLVQDMIEASVGRDLIALSEPINEAMLGLRSFLFEQVYLSPVAKTEEPKAKNVVKALFGYYVNNFDEVPLEYRVHKDGTQVECVQSCIDYVAGMTDRYALRLYEELFIPSSWDV